MNTIIKSFKGLAVVSDRILGIGWMFRGCNGSD